MTANHAEHDALATRLGQRMMPLWCAFVGPGGLRIDVEPGESAAEFLSRVAQAIDGMEARRS